MPTLIDFLTHRVHPFTAGHPLYRSLIDFPPDGYQIVESDKDEGEYPCWVPTCPTYNGPRKQFVFIEDWHTLFDAGNGRSFDFDIRGKEVQKKKEWLSQPSVLGIISHMRATVQDCITLFGQELSHKIHYVPLALPPSTPFEDYHPRRPRTGPTRFLWTSSHGGNGVESCWRLRGGPETLEAFTRLITMHGGNATLTLVGAPPLAALPGNVTRIDGFQTEEAMHQLHVDNDVMLIPSVRIHSITVARAMRYGMPLITSDGWGYKEMTDGTDAAIICPGQWGLTSWHDQVFRECYDRMPPLNETLVNHLVQAMKTLMDPDRLAIMSANAFRAAEERFDVGKRNEILKKILDEKLL